jgi:hypothetical protein
MDAECTRDLTFINRRLGRGPRTRALARAESGLRCFPWGTSRCPDTLWHAEPKYIGAEFILYQLLQLLHLSF